VEGAISFGYFSLGKQRKVPRHQGEKLITQIKQNQKKRKTL